jgi:hypothetical protein
MKLAAALIATGLLCAGLVIIPVVRWNWRPWSDTYR